MTTREVVGTFTPDNGGTVQTTTKRRNSRRTGVLLVVGSVVFAGYYLVRLGLNSHGCEFPLLGAGSACNPQGALIRGDAADLARRVLVATIDLSVMLLGLVLWFGPSVIERMTTRTVKHVDPRIDSLNAQVSALTSRFETEVRSPRISAQATDLGPTNRRIDAEQSARQVADASQTSRISALKAELQDVELRLATILSRLETHGVLSTQDMEARSRLEVRRTVLLVELANAMPATQAYATGISPMFLVSSMLAVSGLLGAIVLIAIYLLRW